MSIMDDLALQPERTAIGEAVSQVIAKSDLYAATQKETEKAWEELCDAETVLSCRAAEFITAAHGTDTPEAQIIEMWSKINDLGGPDISHKTKVWLRRQLKKLLLRQMGIPPDIAQKMSVTI